MKPLYANIITLNEIDNLKNLIPQLDFFDRIIVIDGGSTDGSVEWLEKQPNVLVSTRKWDGDFSAQRNEALKITPNGVWVMKIDPDEVPTKILKRDIRELLGQAEKQGVDRLNIDIVHLVEDTAHCNKERQVGLRIFRYDKNVTWVGRTHEYPQADFKGKGASLPFGCSLVHLRYIIDDGKNERYLNERIFSKENLDALIIPKEVVGLPKVIEFDTVHTHPKMKGVIHHTPVSLHIIAKDETEKLKNIIDKYQKYFLFVDIAIDDPQCWTAITEYAPFNEKVSVYKYSDTMPSGRINFADKRNFLVGKCKTEYYMTLDTDDEVVNPELIQTVADDAAHRGLSVVYAYYDYSKDEHGVTNAAHYKERVIKNTKNLYWNKPIHENIIPYSRVGLLTDIDDRIYVKHNIDHGHSVESLKRNMLYLIEEYNRDKENTDPRTLAYLGRTLFGMGNNEQAKFFLEKHISSSGWDEDRYLSWCQLSDVFRREKNIKEAIACAFEALQEKPEYPEAYFKLHDAYFEEGKWRKALDWSTMGFTKEIPKSFMMTDPSSYTWVPLLSTSFCLFQLGEMEKAISVLEKAERYIPDHPWIVENKRLYVEGYERKKYVLNLVDMVHLMMKFDAQKVPMLISSIPEVFHENETIAKLRNHFIPPATWDDKSIVVYCGTTAEYWSPKSTEKGIGGSEEAVIHLTKQLARLGYEVTVFNKCGDDEGTHDGVRYVNFQKFNPRDHFSTIISWRSNIFLYGIYGKNRVIWIHDLPSNLELSSDTEKTFDKIIVLSEYHKSLLPKDIPKHKIVVSTNGIVPEDFTGLAEIPRQKHRMIYASSYDRGLEILLKNWGEIRKAVSDAELHIFYGWNTYDAYERDGLKPAEITFKPRMVELMKQPGVFEHGRIGHKQLLAEYAKSDILAYPSTYAGEINCIALTKAVACGCQCVTNDKYALKERNPHFVVRDEEYIPALIKALRGEIYQFTNTKKYIQANSWEAVAKDWDERIIKQSIPTALIHRVPWIHRKCGGGKKIVDIGSNKGHVFYGWDREKITSVDIDEYDIQNFVKADAADLPFKDGSFDIAVLAEIVEHVKDPIKVLSEARRVSKKVVVTVPYEHEWREYLRPFNTWEKEEKYRGRSRHDIAKEGNPTVKQFHNEDLQHLLHETFYTPFLLREHLRRAGFKDINIVRLRDGDWVWLGAEARG